MSRFENQQNIATRDSLAHEKTYVEISFWFSKRLIVHKQQVYTHPIVVLQPIKTTIKFKTCVKWKVTFIKSLNVYANVNAQYLYNIWHD